MAATFKLQVFTQEKKVFDGEVTSIIVPGEDGYFGVLAHHAPLVGTLGKGVLTIKGGAREDLFKISGGFIEVHDNLATLLVDDLVAA
jgi:F-type H+-transporting ATPase subunit epsilon